MSEIAQQPVSLMSHQVDWLKHLALADALLPVHADLAFFDYKTLRPVGQKMGTDITVKVEKREPTRSDREITAFLRRVEIGDFNPVEWDTYFRWVELKDVGPQACEIYYIDLPGSDYTTRLRYSGDEDIHPYSGSRNYQAFGYLAGVRRDTDHLPAFTKLVGLPGEPEAAVGNSWCHHAHHFMVEDTPLTMANDFNDWRDGCADFIKMCESLYDKYGANTVRVSFSFDS